MTWSWWAGVTQVPRLLLRHPEWEHRHCWSRRKFTPSVREQGASCLAASFETKSPAHGPSGVLLCRVPSRRLVVQPLSGWSGEGSPGEGGGRFGRRVRSSGRPRWHPFFYLESQEGPRCVGAPGSIGPPTLPPIHSGEERKKVTFH